MSPKLPIVTLESVSKTFKTSSGPLTILEGVSFQIMRGEKVAIIGPSGSGKSTLLSLIGLLDTPTEGNLNIAEVDTKTLSPGAEAAFRNQHIGFIFQSFELISPFTVLENINAPLDIRGEAYDKDRAHTLMAELGLESKADILPFTLSGGEKQRVAIARALIHKPDLLLADEPTGSLDRATGERVLSLLIDLVEKVQTTLIIITHDEAVAARMDRVFEIKDRTVHERH